MAPLRYGAGMKGKVGEALATGLPVVLTSVAAEGMGLVDGEHVLVADTAEAFAAAVATPLHRRRALATATTTRGAPTSPDISASTGCDRPSTPCSIAPLDPHRTTQADPASSRGRAVAASA